MIAIFVALFADSIYLQSSPTGGVYVARGFELILLYNDMQLIRVICAYVISVIMIHLWGIICLILRFTLLFLLLRLVFACFNSVYRIELNKPKAY